MECVGALQQVSDQTFLVGLSVLQIPAACQRILDLPFLFIRGIFVYLPGKEAWHIQPALRMAAERSVPPELFRRALSWYEARGRIQDALTCCWYLKDRETYEECLIRNYDKIPFLNYEKPGKNAAGRRSPELFYIEWMEACLRQDAAAMEQMRERLQDLRAESAAQ